MTTIGGLNYTYADLVRMSGLSKATLIRRYADNPKTTLQALIAPPKTGGKPRRMVIVRNKEMSLYAWADLNSAPRADVDKRWKIGIRDPFKLIQGIKGMSDGGFFPPITEEMIDWLNETAFARKGLPDEWEIACELIGISKVHAERLKEFVEGKT